MRSFHADAVVNINSVLGYRALGHYGSALADSERLFLLFFCNEQLPRGNWVGLPLRQFYRNVDVVEGVITDSAYLAGWLREQFALGEDVFPGLHVFRAPVDPSLEPAGRPSARPDRRPRVYWAGRLDRQKRVGLVAEIARRLPDVDFLMWGQADLDGAGTRADLPPNIALQGSYDHITELDLGDADLWLYTSGWDGVPSVLLEVGMTGVPIVGTLVGGTGEVLTDEHSWPVPEDAGATAYVDAIRAVLADPAGSAQRAAALRERLLAERTEEAFADHVASVLLRPEEER
ncbi:glycosyltransferase family 4 protein [Nocardioides sp. TF02-7]|uniref:glycosyltransferase family 4 protein n=1 Tax=Nocardioides sp. TF02-7 TaxID=2917724 RepID=UPI001F060F17|nr:glycosyltransferase family 4 protein [Nocardioides sp. TF02-7]UMG93045.1 glycosyltransferase family 4 protein [Nocardioides sp. TF02-7]